MKKRLSAKKLLIGWINACPPLEDGISNFTSNWNNGLNLSALVNCCKPGLIPDHASLNPNDRMKNVSHAMDLAEIELGVPKVLSPEYLTVGKPDELSVMTYISGFCHPDSVWHHSLLEWVNSKIPGVPVFNFTTDWSSGKALAALVDSLSQGNFPESEEMKEDESYKNCQDAVKAAKSLLGVDCDLIHDDFSENSIHQLTRSTYITKLRYAKPQIQECLASQMKVVGPGIRGDTIKIDTIFEVRGPRIPHWAIINATIMDPIGLEVPVKSHRISSEAILFFYFPKVAGEYVIEIKMNSKFISGSPFKLIHMEESVDIGSDSSSEQLYIYPV